MRLDITTPFVTVLHTDEAVHVRAEDASGAFGILSGHADFLTVLNVSVLTWRDREASEHYVALRGGVLAARGGNLVTVTTAEAVAGEDLHRLETEVLSLYQSQADEERAAHTEAQRLHLAAIRQIMRLLRSEPGHAPPIG